MKSFLNKIRVTNTRNILVIRFLITKGVTKGDRSYAQYWAEDPIRFKGVAFLLDHPEDEQLAKNDWRLYLFSIYSHGADRRSRSNCES